MKTFTWESPKGRMFKRTSELTAQMLGSGMSAFENVNKYYIDGVEFEHVGFLKEFKADGGKVPERKQNG